MGNFLVSDFLFGTNIWNLNGLFFTSLWLLALIYFIFKLIIEKVGTSLFIISTDICGYLTYHS